MFCFTNATNLSARSAVESLEGDARADGDTKNVRCAEIASSQDSSAAMFDVTKELYIQDVTSESVTATDAEMRSNDDDAQLFRSSSYEDIYVGTKLPGDDEHSDDEGGVLKVSDIGDRFDSRPASTAVRRQSGRRSSSFENLYEMQRREAPNDAENDGVQWQMKESSCEDLSEKDSMLAPFPPPIGQARRNSPIDITVESGLDRVGQSEEYDSRKRSPSHLLQHSMSYDVVDPAQRHLVLGSSSSLDGDEDDGAADLRTERNTTQGIRNGCGCTV